MDNVNCRICGSRLPAPFLDLGVMPLANAFLKSAADVPSERAFPLAVALCGECGLAQLTYTVPADVLYRDYIYVSSTSDAVKAHAASLAERLSAQYHWGPADRIVEVASNDGTVLKAFQARGLPVLGIEPARNIAAIAVADGVPTVPEFFTTQTATEVVAAHGHAAAILGRHVFAHVDDVHDFLGGVDRLLTPDGVLLIEVPYFGDLVETLEFDTVYHEHLSYFALQPVDRLMTQHGFRLVDVEPVSLHGGSILMHIRRAARGDAPSARLAERLDAERRQRLTDPGRLAAFARDVHTWKRTFERFIDDLAVSGARLAGYGAAAKANTLLNYCPSVAAHLVAILDKSPHKHGRLTPGTHLRVEPVDRWQELAPTHMLILAWNFRDEIMRQMQPFADAGGRFVVPIPSPQLVSLAR